jgi:hypothetical protein
MNDHDHDPFKGFPKVGLTPQPLPVSQGFSGKGKGPGSLAHSIGQRLGSHVNYGNLKPIEVPPGAYTPPLSSVSNPHYSELQQKHVNALFQSRVQYHRATYPRPQSAEPSPSSQSRLGNMFREAGEFARSWSQRPHQQHQQHQQQQQQQQRPHTNAGQRAKMTRERALHIMRLPAGSNPSNGVKKAFRKAVLKYHPDKTIADRKEVAAAKANKYKKIHKAYDVLTNPHADVDDTSEYYTTDDDDGMAKIGGNNTIKRRHKKHKLAKKTRGKKHSNRRNKTRGKTYRKTRKNTTKRR